MRKYFAFFVLFIVIVGCSNQNFLIENWNNYAPKKIGIVGVLPIKPYFKYINYGDVIFKDINNHSAYWWNSEVNDSMISVLAKKFPEYMMTGITISVNKENIFSSSTTFLELINALGYENLDEVQKTNFINKIAQLSDLFNVDAIFLGFSEIDEEQFHFERGRLASKYFLFSKDGKLLWSYNNSLFTDRYHSPFLSFDIRSYYWNHCALLLLQESITDISNNFPHFGGENINRGKRIKFLPIVLYNSQKLVVESYYLFSFKITDKNGRLIYQPEKKATKYIWNYRDLSNKIVTNDRYYLTFDDTTKHYFIEVNLH